MSTDTPPVPAEIVAGMLEGLASRLLAVAGSTEGYAYAVIDVYGSLPRGEFYADLRKVAQALTRLQYLESLERWQDISTAPRDRTPVTIAVPTKNRDDYIVGEAYFDPENGEWWWAGTGPGDYHGGPISEVNHHLPTHWRPLPTPPGIHS